MSDSKHETRSDVSQPEGPTAAQRQEEGRSRGGQRSSGNFKNAPERAAAAGRKGGQVSGGNFKNDPQRASAAGQKGGHASHAGHTKST